MAWKRNGEISGRSKEEDGAVEEEEDPGHGKVVVEEDPHVVLKDAMIGGGEVSITVGEVEAVGGSGGMTAGAIVADSVVTITITTARSKTVPCPTTTCHL